MLSAYRQEVFRGAAIGEAAYHFERLGGVLLVGDATAISRCAKAAAALRAVHTMVVAAGPGFDDVKDVITEVGVWVHAAYNAVIGRQAEAGARKMARAVETARPIAWTAPPLDKVKA